MVNPPIQKQDLRLIPSKLDASVLDLTVIQSHWYVDIFTLRTNASFITIGSAVLMIYSIFSKIRDIPIKIAHTPTACI